MLETTITGLPNATTPLSGAERVPIDQDGQTVDAPASAIAALAPGTDLAYTAATRTLASSTGADVVLPLATTTAPGLAPTLPGGTSTFLRSDGTFATPPGGATDLSYDPGTALLSSSTGTDVTLTLADATNPGLLSAAGFSKLASITVDEARLVVVPVRNNSGAPITRGTPVYVTGSSGTRITIAPADASVEATAAGTLGLVYASISNNADGLVLAVGQLDGISTAGLTEGAIAWLSETTGQITTTRPVAPAHGVALGYVVKTGAGTSGILYVKVDNGLELDELHNVLIVNPQTRQVLYRNAAGLWVNQSLAAADISDSTALGRSLLTVADAAAARSAISAEQAGAAAAAQAFAIQRANHTGTQAASTITGLATVATTGAYGDLSGRPTLFDPASPGAIGGTTPAAGTFTGLVLPAQGSAPAAPATGFRMYAGSGNALSWIGANGFVRVFDGTANTADRTYTLPNASGTIGLLTSAAPANLAATAAAGTAGDAARADHVHARPTLGELGAASTAAFTSSTAGLVPASGGGTSNFLRADGTFAAPSSAPAGSSGQLQWNNGGSAAGLSTSSIDGSGNLTFSGRWIVSTNGAASAPPVALTGTWFSGGTATTTKPQLLIEPAGTTSTSWSTSGTGLGVNAPSGFAGDLAWFGVNGTSYLRMSSTSGQSGGTLTIRAGGTGGGTIALSVLNSAGTENATISANGVISGLQGSFSNAINSNAISLDVSNQDVVLKRDAAGTLAQRNATNAQAFRVYNTFTSTTDHERGKLEWSANLFCVGTEKGSTGGTARAMALQTDGVTRIAISATGGLGFYGAAASAQPAAVADATDAASVITQLNALLSRLRTIGIIAT